MSTGFYLVCDETKLFCAVACDTMGSAGDYGATDRGKFTFIISHQDFRLRIVDEHEDLLWADEYRNWEHLKECAEIHFRLTAEEAALLEKADA